VGNNAFDPAATFLIQRQTVTGSPASITFSSIPSTYKHLQIRGISRDFYSASQAAFNVLMRFNNDSGTNYTDHRIWGTGSGVSAYGSTGSSSIVIPYSSSSSNSSNTTAYGASICDILDYTSTTKNKTVKIFSGFDFNTASADYRVSLNSGLWLNTNAITTITLLPGVTAFNAGTTFALYGMKG
jgi:hypothetical protein